VGGCGAFKKGINSQLARDIGRDSPLIDFIQNKGWMGRTGEDLLNIEPIQRFKTKVFSCNYLSSPEFN